MTRSRIILTYAQHHTYKHLCGLIESETTLRKCAECQSLLNCLLSHGIAGKDELTEKQIRDSFPALRAALKNMLAHE